MLMVLVVVVTPVNVHSLSLPSGSGAGDSEAARWPKMDAMSVELYLDTSLLFTNRL